MPDRHRLSILHVSDLHARSVDVGELPEDAQQRRRSQVELEERIGPREDVLGERWDDCLRELYASDRPDLVCFTGDVADYGLATEYAEATSFVERTLAVLGVERSRVFVVPGNHDVQRHVNARQWKQLREAMGSEAAAVSEGLARGNPPRPPGLPRVSRLGAPLPGPRRRPRLRLARR